MLWHSAAFLVLLPPAPVPEQEIDTLMALGAGLGLLVLGVCGLLMWVWRKRVVREKFRREHWRRCWRCVRPVEDGPRGVCAHCCEPWEYEMLKYAWRTRFKDLTEDEKPKA
ncbi:MAG: hypothetical protein AAGI30_03250 [Planctomycetota bacterium]